MGHEYRARPVRSGAFLFVSSSKSHHEAHEEHEEHEEKNLFNVSTLLVNFSFLLAKSFLLPL